MAAPPPLDAGSAAARRSAHPSIAGDLLAVLYRASARVATPFVYAHLRRRATAGREDPLRLGERRGIPSAARPDGDLVWLHAASVGEALSLLPLIAAMQRRWPRTALLVTTGTPTSAALMATRLPAGVVHQYLPVDLPRAVERFAAYWRPAVALLVESELWPNLLDALHRHGAPAIIINGRMSARSFRRWGWLRPLVRRTLSQVAVTFAQAPADAERFRALGAGDVRVTANLKAAAPPLPAPPEREAALAAAVGCRRCWIAASTHPGEEALVADAHAALRGEAPHTLTVIAPRHAARGPEIARELAASGLRVARQGAGDAPGAGVEVFVADAMGELGLWYRLCGAAFLGGSLVPHGGHNPLEAVRVGCPVVVGPHTHNFDEFTLTLARLGAVQRIAAPQELAAAVRIALAQPRQKVIEAAATLVATGARALDEIVAAVAMLAPRLE